MDWRLSRALLLALAGIVGPLPGARAWGQGAPPAAAEPAGPGPAAPEPLAPPVAPPPGPPSALPPAPEPPPPAPSWGGPEETVVVEAPVPEPVRRPRLSAAVGMGASFDAVGFSDGNTRAIPSFFTVLGIGDGSYGFDIGAFASEAAGRHGNQSPVD